MNIASLITLVLLAAFLLFALLSALIGLLRGLKKTVGSTVVIVVSAIIAFIVTALAFKPTPSRTGFITKILLNILDGSEIGTLFAMDGVRDALNYYVCMIAAPFIFVALFVVIRFVLAIVMRIVMRFIPIMNNIPKVAKRLGGLGVGLVNGVALFLILFMPLLGTVDVVNMALTDIREMAENEAEADELCAPETDKPSAFVELGKYDSDEDLDDEYYDEDYDEDYDEYDDEDESVDSAEVLDGVSTLLDSVSGKGIGKFALSCGGRGMYNSLTSAKYNGKRVVLRDEVGVVINVVGGLTSIGEDSGSLITVFDTLADGVERSPIIANIAADVVSEMAHCWIDGEEFLGISKMSMGSFIDPIIDTVLEVLATETDETIHDDLKSISDFMHKADEYGFLNASDMDSDEFQKFGEEGTLASLLYTVVDNERMLPLVDELNVTCIRIFSDDLGFLENHEELYEDLIAEIAGIINEYRSYMINETEARDEIYYQLRDHGVVLSKEESATLCDALFFEFRSYDSDMYDNVQDFFRLYSAIKNSTLVEKADGTLVAGGFELKTYTASDYRYSHACVMASTGVSIGDAESITSGKDIKTVLVTTEDIINSIVKYENIKNRREEVDRIDSVIVSMIGAYNNLGGDTLHASHVMAEMGIVLDNMHDTSSFGNVTGTFLTALMQSHKVADSIGLDIVEMTDFANKVQSGKDNGAGYKDISVTVSHTFDVLENINKGEVQEDTVQELMKDLTPETAKVMQEIATPSLMQSYGVKEENAEQSAEAVGSLFGNMADYTTTYPQGDKSDEEYKEEIAREAEAVDKIITLAVKVNEDGGENKTIFNSEGETGKLDMSAYDVVDLFATSVVAQDTLDDMTTDSDSGEEKFDPLGASQGLTEADKQEVSDALAQYKQDNAHVEDIDEKLSSIASFLGIEYVG